METSSPDFASRLGSANIRLQGDTSYAATDRVVPALGREQAGVLLTEAAGIPVHAVVASGNATAPSIVLNQLRAAAQRSILVTFANPSTALMARRSAAFGRDLLAFDFVLPDGIGMCMAIRWLHGLPARRVSFDMTSLGPLMFGHAQAEDQTIVLVGGAPGVAERARDRIVDHYPGLRIIGAFGGYGDMQATMGQVIGLQPQILICGMGSIRQEAFLLGMRMQGWRGWGFTCGGFMDQLQSKMNYYPRWVDRANLRWAYRLIREPGRLWRRYLIEYSKFGLMVCAARVRR